MASAAVYLIPVIAFVLIYEGLRRHGTEAGSRAPVQWGWLVAILGCAAVAVLLGLLL